MSDSHETSAYGAMAQVVEHSIVELLVPFHMASDPRELLGTMSTDDFFRKFLVYADKSTGQCCQDLAKIFRQTSLVPEVRGVPTLELAKQIRHSVFENLDKILLSYVQTLNQINFDLGEASRNLTESSVLAEGLKGAAYGRVAGGFGDTGKVLGAVGAISAVATETRKKLALLQHQNALVEEARNLAFTKVIEYLKTVEALPENLLDYGCAKCFGGAIDFPKQTHAIEQVRESITDKLRQALEFTLRLQQIEREQAEKACQAAAARAEQKASEDSKSFNKGCGGCLIAFAIMGLLGALVDLFSSGMNSDVGGTISGVVICVGLLAWGVHMLGKAKKPDSAEKPPVF